MDWLSSVSDLIYDPHKTRQICYVRQYNIAECYFILINPFRSWYITHPQWRHAERKG